jgi:hypothetical protein
MASGGAWRIAEPMTECPCKIVVVEKTAGVGNLAERLPFLHQCPAMQQVRGMIQAKRLYEMAAGRAAYRE